MTEEQQIQKAFNAAYTLNKHAPALAQKIYQGLQEKDHPFTTGFEAGRKEAIKERSQNKKQDFEGRLKQRLDDKTKDQGLDRGR